MDEQHRGDAQHCRAHRVIESMGMLYKVRFTVALNCSAESEHHRPQTRLMCSLHQTLYRKVCHPPR